MRKFFSFFLIFSVLIFSFALTAGAVYTPYGGVTDTSSAVKVLTDYYINSDDYKSGDDFIVMRTSQTEYILFYGDLDTTSVNYIRYSYLSNQYNDYKIDTGKLTDFTYQLNGYTVVGTLNGTLQSSSYVQSNFNRNAFLVLVIIAVFTLVGTIRNFFAGRFE